MIKVIRASVGSAMAAGERTNSVSIEPPAVEVVVELFMFDRSVTHNLFFCI